MAILIGHVEQNGFEQDIQRKESQRTYRQPTDKPLANACNQRQTHERLEPDKKPCQELSNIPRKQFMFEHEHIHGIDGQVLRNGRSNEYRSYQHPCRNADCPFRLHNLLLYASHRSSRTSRSCFLAQQFIYI